MVFLGAIARAPAGLVAPGRRRLSWSLRAPASALLVTAMGRSGLPLLRHIAASGRLVSARGLRRLSRSLRVCASGGLGRWCGFFRRVVLRLPVGAVSRAPPRFCRLRGRLLSSFCLHNSLLGLQRYEVRVDVRPAPDLFGLYASLGAQLKGCGGDVFDVVVVF